MLSKAVYNLFRHWACAFPLPCLSATRRKLDRTVASLHRTQDELRLELAVSAALRDLYKPLISPGSTIGEIADVVLEKACDLTQSTHGYVSAIDLATGDNVGHTLTATRLAECMLESRLREVRFTREADGGYRGLWGHALNTGESFFTNSPAGHPAAAGAPAGHIQLRRFLSVPVMLNGKAAGQIALANAPQDFTSRDLRIVGHLARFYALALQHKQSEHSTFAALREKEVLLREIHHRVKNNLQVISSLLSLQAGGLHDPQALEMLNESQNRVRAMAMVHEQLHRSRDLSGIWFDEYVKNLCASLFCSYGIDSYRISLLVDVEEISFPIDTAIPCGLMIHELVSNSLKHAFPGDRNGEIRVSLKPVPDRRIELRVSDNGIGLPSTVDIQETNSLGLRLVRILAAQIDASVACFTGGGTAFIVNFRSPEEQQQIRR